MRHPTLTSPHLWFPAARSLRRRIVAHVGPPNSGKTHNAIQSLAASPSGIYAAPLRLLAQEVHQRLTATGLPTNLLTGQEHTEVPTARHTSCTVEMAAAITDHVHCAVLDEAQLIADQGRGWAWTRMLLGANADELLLCGNESVVFYRAAAGERLRRPSSGG